MKKLLYEFLSFVFIFLASIQTFSQSLEVDKSKRDYDNSYGWLSEAEVVVNYDGNNSSGVGAASSTFIIAAKYTTAVTAQYVGSPLIKVRVYVYQPTVGNTGTLRIYGPGTPTAPGAELLSQPVTTTSPAWNEFILTTPVTVPNGDLWVGLEATANADPNQFWGGVDAGPNHPEGQYIYFSGAWSKLVALNPALTYNWNIRAVIDYTPTGPGVATNPNPANGATNISITTSQATWTNPAGATSNAFYFGTHPDSLTLLQSGTLATSFSIPSGTLTYKTNYYWKVNETDGTGTTTGPIWNFKTQPDPNDPTILSEDFETTAFPPSDWSLVSTVGTTQYWTRQTTASGYGLGTASARYAFFNSSAGNDQSLITPTFPVPIASGSLSFDHAYATYTGNQIDQLQIEYSTDAGSSWSILITLDGGNTGPLATAPGQSAAFVPTSGQWATKTYTLPVGTNKIKFRAKSQFGNNLFMDNIKVLNLDAGVLAPFNLTAPAAGVTVTSIPASTTPVTIIWDTSRAAATYKWIFGAPTVPPRILTVPVGTNNLTLTLGQIDAILAGLGVAQGDSVVGVWDVWAFRNNAPAYDSLKATNGPRAITLKRQKPALSPFSLVSPPNNTTLVTSVFNTSPVNITWRKSGDGVTYKWKYGTGLESKKTDAAILTVPSNNGGFDTVLTLINSAVDGILAGLGVAPGDSSVGQWTVYAYSGTDSLKATQTFNITFKRQAKGEVLIAYDSTSAVCRTSKDSVSLYLNNKGMTFDLFNRSTQTATNVLSYRGYKSIIWLGEGTSVMSVAQKDSMKSYLNNPPAGQRSKLIIFAEDIGYQFGRTSPTPSTYLDLDFMNNYLGANYVADYPGTSTGGQGMYGSYLNPGLKDSTVGTFPDVLSRFDPPSTHDLYKFNFDNSTNGIGKVGATFNVCTFGVDIESLRWAVDGPAVPPYKTRLDGAYLYINTDGTLIPVELTSFTANVASNNVMLNWSTATEVNNSGFQVERKSINGNYTSVGFVQGKGTTTEEQNYIFSDNGLAVGTYTYRLIQMDFDGTFEFSPEVEAEVGAPSVFELSQNYPNPFNPSTSVKFSLVTDSKVTLKLFDVIGQEIATLLNTNLASGYHSVAIDGSRLSSGVYFYRLDATGINGQKYSSVKKMILTK